MLRLHLKETPMSDPVKPAWYATALAWFNTKVTVPVWTGFAGAAIVFVIAKLV